MKGDQNDVDLFRDTSVRYLGYANEIGEAFRCIVPNSIVWLSYLISSGYVVADTVDKGYKTYRLDTSQEKGKKVLLSSADALIWQSFASVVIPGFTINRICAGVRYLQRKCGKSGYTRHPLISTAVGLASIPFIIHPIDEIVTAAMNVSYRKWVGSYP